MSSTPMSAYRMAYPIPITPMPQLAEVGRIDSYRREKLADSKQAVDREDDWTGVTDAASRRKRQTRLNTECGVSRMSLNICIRSYGQLITV